jgi:hypothetical protein
VFLSINHNLGRVHRGESWDDVFGKLELLDFPPPSVFKRQKITENQLKFWNDDDDWILDKCEDFWWLWHLIELARLGHILIAGQHVFSADICSKSQAAAFAIKTLGYGEKGLGVSKLVQLYIRKNILNVIKFAFDVDSYIGATTSDIPKILDLPRP